MNTTYPSMQAWSKDVEDHLEKRSTVAASRSSLPATSRSFDCPTSYYKVGQRKLAGKFKRSNSLSFVPVSTPSWNINTRHTPRSQIINTYNIDINVDNYPNRRVININNIIDNCSLRKIYNKTPMSTKIN